MAKPGNVKYIEKHLVKKPVFRLKTKSGKSIDVTGDHSCMVLRGNKLEKIIAKDIKPGDKFISLQ
jgi:intein/homing endonuclease